MREQKYIGPRSHRDYMDQHNPLFDRHYPEYIHSLDKLQLMGPGRCITGRHKAKGISPLRHHFPA
ncbi:hypothetical protein [Paenibacillus lutimineralis]|uniref:hypothetical protein n=1 Tax=Paenibacillus lutimineralis TaxID=2707005 RepID=UPI001D0568FD|nr:hypothetical protein [Paenibacillus lutimineralis]